jgi:hypothetical protein
MHHDSILALALALFLGLTLFGGSRSDAFLISNASAHLSKAPSEADGNRLDRYYVAVRLLRDGAKNFRGARYAKARVDWTDFLSLDAVREGAGDDAIIATAPTMIRRTTAQSLFAKLHQHYDEEGDQRPAGMPQIPIGVNAALSAAERGNYQKSRQMLGQAAIDSPKLHRIPFLLGLLDILAGNEDGAARCFLRLTALPPEYASPDIVDFSEEQFSAVRWLANLARRRAG